MTHELTVLVLAALLQMAQMILYSVLGNMQAGTKAALSSRDEPIRLTGAAGRAQRAMTNHFEGLVLFTIAVVAVTVADKSSGFTAACASIYLVARILYVPAYLQGLVPWRTVIWAAGWLATLAMLLAALF